MAKSRKRKPSFDTPADAAGKSDTAWVYRSQPDEPGHRASKPADPPATKPPAAAAPPADRGRRRAAPRAARQDAPPQVDAAPRIDAPPPIDEPPPAPPVPAAEGRTASGHAIIDRHVWYASAAGLLPVPLMDMAAIAGVQVAMVHALARHYGLPFDRDRGKAIVTAVAGGVVSTTAGRSVLKMLVRQVPIAGTAFSLATVPAFAGSATYAVGCVFNAHFEKGGTLDDFDVEASRRQLAEAVALPPLT